MKKISLIFYIALFLACKASDSKENRLKPDDTVKIISAVLNGRVFLKENVKVDKIFFLRNKFFSESWLKSKSSFKLASLENTSRTRMTNVGPGFPSDSRQRLSLFKFEYKNDTAKVDIYEYGGHLFYETELGLKKENWIILKQGASSGGRMEKFEFEDEKWYLDLKKKIKPHLPMFPPPAPKNN